MAIQASHAGSTSPSHESETDALPLMIVMAARFGRVFVRIWGTRMKMFRVELAGTVFMVAENYDDAMKQFDVRWLGEILSTETDSVEVDSVVRIDRHNLPKMWHDCLPYGKENSEGNCLSWIEEIGAKAKAANPGKCTHQRNMNGGWAAPGCPEPACL
jgi:hypothetical protein